MDVTLLQLRYFLAVARERHFARAAAGLRISPSTLSEQIAGFERMTGRRLFERGSRSVSLTAHGEELMPLAERAVAAADDVVRWGSGTENDALTIGVMVSSPPLREILSAASAELTGVDLSVRPVGFAGGIPALRSGEVDCAFLSVIPGAAAPEGVAAFEMWAERLFVALPADHRLAGRDRVSTADLWGETLIAPARTGRADGRPWGDWYGAIDAELLTRCRMSRSVTSADETVELVAAGIGANIIGASALSLYARPGVVFVPLDTDAEAVTMLVVRDGAMSSALAGFVRIARRSAARAD